MINNWKLKEIIEDVEIIHPKSQEYESIIFKENNIPKKINDVYSKDRTQIEWMKMPNYNKFYVDDKEEIIIESALKNSDLGKYESIILTYGWDEPVVKIPSGLFFDDWEGFVRSQGWEGIIFSPDFKYILEPSSDYYFHSNLKLI